MTTIGDALGFIFCLGGLNPLCLAACGGGASAGKNDKSPDAITDIS